MFCTSVFSLSKLLLHKKIDQKLLGCASVLNVNEKIQSLTTLGIELNQVHDLDILMEHLLSRAREFVSADAGSIYIKDGDHLKFTYTQNKTLQDRIPEREKLIYSIYSIPIDETSLAGYVAGNGEILNIPDVYNLDQSLPFKFSKIFDIASDYKTQSVLTLPLKSPHDKIIGILQIINSQDNKGNIRAFSKNDEEIMYHFASVAAVALRRAKMTRSMILRMIKMAELRDPKETGAHVNRVAEYSIELYERWAVRHGILEEERNYNRDILRMAAMLHDVGKVAISDMILKKPGRLNKEEFETMKGHSLHGARLFRMMESEYEEAASIVTFTHHEKWDGSGYPGHVDILTGIPDEKYMLPDGSARGKKGEEIPIFGRIVALADVFDALSSARVYKNAWREEDVLALIRKESGAHFDPELVEIFFEALDVIRSIQDKYDSGGLG